MSLPEGLKLFDGFDFDDQSLKNIKGNWNDGICKENGREWKVSRAGKDEQETRRRNFFAFQAVPEIEYTPEEALEDDLCMIFEMTLCTNWRERKVK